MVKITEQLLRKRSEHNNCEISTLEEVSLHQEDIEKIEHLDKWCRELKILYLQGNVIAKIENVSRLKKLEYLNLALNCIERVENLEGCESLNKLDLTVNFIGDITSLSSLKGNIHLKELYLTGNPCAQYDGYREYVISTLPQLQSLDGTRIHRSHQIKATQDVEEKLQALWHQQNENMLERQRQRIEAKRVEKEAKLVDETDLTAEEREAKRRDFWAEESGYTPEARVEMQRRIREEKGDAVERLERSEPSLTRSLFNEDGRPYNVNEPKLEFNLSENDEKQSYILDLSVYKHLDSSLLDVDVQPNYLRIIVKGKIFQLHLRREVNTDRSKAQRSGVTGHLLLTMPFMDAFIKSHTSAVTGDSKLVGRSSDSKLGGRSSDSKLGGRSSDSKLVGRSSDSATDSSGDTEQVRGALNKREWLEVGDLSWKKDKVTESECVDDSDVPPLM